MSKPLRGEFDAAHKEIKTARIVQSRQWGPRSPMIKIRDYVK